MTARQIKSFIWSVRIFNGHVLSYNWKNQFFFSWSSEDKEINFGVGKSQTGQVQNNLIIKKQHKRPANSLKKNY